MNGPERPFGISSVGFGLCEECPVYSRKRRKSRHSLTSPQCQLRPSCTAAKRLFDHLVGEREQLRRYFEERPSGLEINHQLEFGGLLDGQFAGMSAFEHLARQHPGLAIDLRNAGAV